MSSFRLLAAHIKKYGMTHGSLYIASIMFFFWSVYDGIISFITPIVLTQSGLSETLMGVVIGTSSMAGAVFDFILARFLKNAHYRRVYMMMFAVCFAYPLILWQSKSIYIFLVAMALWGIYYDLLNFGNFDFIGRQTKPDEHASSFGVMSVFRSLGYLVGPVIAGLLIGELVDVKVFIAAWVFLVISFLVYLGLTFMLKTRQEYMKTITYKHKNTALELQIWKKVGKRILPILVFTTLLYIYDAFFWTIGPLYSESLGQLHPLGGLFMTFYTFPSLIVGWFVGATVAKFGKNRTSFVSFALGSAVLIAIPFLVSPILILLAVFVSSCLTSIAFNSNQSSYADFITDKPSAESEIEGLGDFSVNIGYVIGPMLAGFVAETIGNSTTFMAVGGVGLIVSIILLAGFSSDKTTDVLTNH